MREKRSSAKVNVAGVNTGERKRWAVFMLESGLYASVDVSFIFSEIAMLSCKYRNELSTAFFFSWILQLDKQPRRTLLKDLIKQD